MAQIPPDVWRYQISSYIPLDNITDPELFMQEFIRRVPTGESFDYAWKHDDPYLLSLISFEPLDLIERSLLYKKVKIFEMLYDLITFNDFLGYMRNKRGSRRDTLQSTLKEIFRTNPNKFANIPAILVEGDSCDIELIPENILWHAENYHRLKNNGFESRKYQRCILHAIRAWVINICVGDTPLSRNDLMMIDGDIRNSDRYSSGIRQGRDTRQLKDITRCIVEQNWIRRVASLLRKTRSISK